MKHFSKLYQAWLEQEKLQAHKAAPLIGVSIATSYKYLNGESLPPGSRIPHLAACLGVTEKALREVTTRDRANNRKRGRK